MRGNVPEHSINLKRICYTERSEVSQTVLVKVNPSPQSSPQGEEEKVLISHTAHSFTRFNYVSSVRLVSSSRVYFYSVIANECEAIQLIYTVGVATPTYNLSMTSRPRTVIPNLFRNLYLVRPE